VALACGFVSIRSAGACPFCALPNPSLREQATEAEIALVVRRVGFKPKTVQDRGTTIFEVVEALHAPGDSWRAEATVSLSGIMADSPGGRYLLLGSESLESTEWQTPIPMTAASLTYLKNAIEFSSSPAQRLAYFLPFLEHPDGQIAEDAFAEIALASYEDVRALRAQLPRDQLRLWIGSNETPTTRLGLYGMLLGLCGDASDSSRLMQKIRETPTEFRLGIDGVMAGYLLLVGEPGLGELDTLVFDDPDATLNDQSAYLQVLRFLWQYEPGFSRPRILHSMHRFLAVPDLVDQVITDLARWKDWSVQARLIELYQAEGYESAAIRRAIIRYTLAASQDQKVAGETESPHVRRAYECLEILERIDPRRVQEARRFPNRLGN